MSSEKPPPDEHMIEVEDLHQGFSDRAGGRVTAVDGVSLAFQRAEVTAILGPNGAGKTTLLDLLLGLNSPDSGAVSILGRTPHRAVQDGLVGALLQTGGLLPDLTVKETVIMIAALHKNPMPVDEVMETAGITSIGSRMVGKCSGGQQQRLKFALALLPRPEVIVLDEPTAGMDVSARHEFWERMNEQARGGATILFATHYLEEAEQFARRTVLMHNGRIIADGPTDDVRAKAGAAHVRASWSPSSADLAGLPHVISYEMQGSQISFRTDDADALARHLLTETGAQRLSIRPASLEEAFMMLTTDSRGRTAPSSPAASEQGQADTEEVSR